jgi:hypothetical protein
MALGLKVACLIGPWTTRSIIVKFSVLPRATAPRGIEPCPHSATTTVALFEIELLSGTMGPIAVNVLSCSPQHVELIGAVSAGPSRKGCTVC